MNFKKLFLTTLTTMTVIGAFLTSIYNSDTNSQLDASWGNETVTIYLDKTYTINSLGWWQTDETFINYTQNGNGEYNTQKMTKISNTLFSWNILGSVWETITSVAQGKIEFWVYNTSGNQNIVFDTQLWFLKQNELNYFRLNSANTGDKQTYTIENKEVEEVAFEISTLVCVSNTTTVQDTVNLYNSLRTAGKTVIQTREITPGVSHYQRLKMIAAFKSISV